jgi:hypothetical protein
MFCPCNLTKEEVKDFDRRTGVERVPLIGGICHNPKADCSEGICGKPLGSHPLTQGHFIYSICILYTSSNLGPVLFHFFALIIYFIILSGTELELERMRLEVLKLQFSRGGSASSGLYTPQSRVKSGLQTPTKMQRSVKYYFDELKKYFKANNDQHRYGIVITIYKCTVYDGKAPVHEEDVDAKDSTSIRNLYLMFHASDYKVEVFLQKREAGEFEDFSGPSLKTPPLFNLRSNVYVVDK